MQAKRLLVLLTGVDLVTGIYVGASTGASVGELGSSTASAHSARWETHTKLETDGTFTSRHLITIASTEANQCGAGSLRHIFVLHPNITLFKRPGFKLVNLQLDATAIEHLRHFPKVLVDTA